MLVSDRNWLLYINSGTVKVEPWDSNLLQPSSLDMRLDKKIFRDGLVETIETETKIWPGEFLIASTVERVSLPSTLAGRVEGKSSLGRLGLLVHVTAGFIDPGFQGTITLELANLSRLPITLKAGQKICQLTLLHMDSPVLRPYGTPELGSKYQGQTEATLSKEDIEAEADYYNWRGI